MDSSNLEQAWTAEALLAHIRHISVAIGPRHPASHAERETAAYIHQVIRQIDPEWPVTNQPFRSIDGFRYRIAPSAALAGISLLVGLQRQPQRKFLAGLFSIGLSVLTRDAFLERPTLWENWLPHGESENVIVRIPPRGRAERRIVLLAHTDSGVHRMTCDPRLAGHLPRTLGAITLMALVGGVLTLLSGRNQRWRGLRGLIGLSALGGAALAIADERGPGVAGANSNASGVATLLGLAAALHAQPLEATEVVLAFTGAATAVSTGADVLATKYGAEWEDALWVVVNNVGQGELCWGTRHGISPYAYYFPHPDAEKMMERVAGERPDLGLMGKPLLSLDELVILQDRDLRAVALTGYDRVTGLIPNWRQNSDTIHAIDPGTTTRAVETLISLAQQMDHDETWPPSV